MPCKCPVLFCFFFSCIFFIRTNIHTDTNTIRLLEDPSFKQISNLYLYLTLIKPGTGSLMATVPYKRRAMHVTASNFFLGGGIFEFILNDLISNRFPADYGTVYQRYCARTEKSYKGNQDQILQTSNRVPSAYGII